MKGLVKISCRFSALYVFSNFSCNSLHTQDVQSSFDITISSVILQIILIQWNTDIRITLVQEILILISV